MKRKLTLLQRIKLKLRGHINIYDDKVNCIYAEEGSNSYTYEEMYKATIKYLKEKEMWNCTYSKETLNKLRELGQFNGKELNDVLAQIIETKNRNK